MAKEYIEREAARSVVCDVCELRGSLYCTYDCKHPIDAIPAADVRPVVLCRDCKHRDPEDKKCDSGQLERAGCVFPVDDDYFCAYGEM